MLSNVGDIGWFISSITQISSIALEPSSSDEIEGKIDEDDEDEAEVKGKKDEVEHYEIKENILRQPQQVVHGDEISENIGVEGGRKTKLSIILAIKVPTATADSSSRPAMILLQVQQLWLWAG